MESEPCGILVENKSDPRGEQSSWRAILVESDSRVGPSTLPWDPMPFSSAVVVDFLAVRVVANLHLVFVL